MPSQTFPNRAFFHAASSSGLVVNDPVQQWYEHNTAETIFDRIEAVRKRGISWNVYYAKSEFQQTVPEEPQAETCFHQALSIARRQAGQILGTLCCHEPGTSVVAPGKAH